MKRRGRQPKNPVATPEVGPGNEPDDTGRLFDYAGDGRVSIHRRDDYTKKFVFHGFLATQDATEAGVMALFGGGDYRLQLRSPDETGREVIRQQRDFRLPGAYKPPTGNLPGITPNPNAGTAAPVLSPAAPADANTIRELVDTAMLSKVLDIMKMSKDAAPASDSKTMEVMMAMMAQQQAATMKFMEVMSALATANRGDMGIRELLPLLTGRTGNSDVTALIRGLKELKELSRDEPEGSGDPILDSVPRVLDTINALAHQRQGASVPAPSQPQLPAQSQPLWRQLLLRQKGQLLSVASRGMDPVWSAETALALMPDQYVGVLREFLLMPEHLSLATQTIPELGNWPVWTQKFFAALVSSLNDEDAGDAGGALDEPDGGPEGD